MTKIDGGLRQLFRTNLPQFDWCSIESGSTGGGIPDMNYCTRVYGDDADGYGKEGWLELKQTPGHRVTLRPEQVGWISRRVRAGGRVWIAVRQQAPAGPRREARDALWLIPGADAKLALTSGLASPTGAVRWSCWHGGPARWDWPQIAAQLTR